MASQPEYPSAARNINTYTTQCQGLTLEDADKQRAHEINLDVKRRMIHDEPDLVKKVTGVSGTGEYSSVAEDIEALWYNDNSDLRRRELFNKAREWFDPDIDAPSGKLESRMYPQLKAFIYLIALYVGDKREQCNLPLQRYLLPHPLSNVQGDPTTRKRHDIVLRWYDPDKDMGVIEECDAFLNGNSQTAKGKHSSKDPKKRQEEAIRERFWRCFGVIECKAQYIKSQEVKDIGQLGWYVCSALEAVFERNNMWGWVVSGTTVRFIFFTHGAAVSSPIIDMKDKKGRQIFIDNFILLCLHRTVRGSTRLNDGWKTINPEKAEIVRAYVNPIPFKIHGGLFGRQTRCHYASLTKFTEDAEAKETIGFVLEESWTELDLNPNEPRNMNTESLPNEVRVFQEIERRKGGCKSKCIEYGLPKLEAGGSVRIEGDGPPGSGYFSTAHKYCGGLNIVNRAYNVQPSTSTATETGSDDTDPPFEVVNRAHQRLLISPIGESLTELHSWARKPGNKTQDLDDYEKEILAIYVQDFFACLFWIIYYLYTELGFYHRDLSEGNVLVRQQDGFPHPLLIDFDYARLRADDQNDNVHSRTGTVPFMSILNLAGRSQSLSIADELESLMYLWVWKCSIGFSPSHITRPNTTSNTSQVSFPQPPRASVTPDVCTRLHATSHKSTSSAQKSKHLVDETEQPSVRMWAKGEPGRCCLNTKIWHTSSNTSFSLVLEDFPPEFDVLKSLLLTLREALFDWDGQQASYFKATSSKSIQGRRTNPPRGNNPNAANEQYMDIMRERIVQAKKHHTPNRLVGQKEYFERLSSRSRDENLDVILKKSIDDIDFVTPLPFI
ncbi:hypothetical protein IWQ61_002601 [Dispira simplex]|nr:hypothetical protein IWQ61_002601 [Dispira simplex]